MAVVELNRVTCRLGGRDAVSGMSFAVDAGDIVAVVGPHGSGKSTLLRLLAGTIGPTSGSLRVAGATAGTRAARLLTGFATDPPLPPPELTGWEWLYYVASQHARSASHRQVLIRYAASLAGIGAFAHRRINRYPRDAAQRLAIAAAAMAGRALVLLDEALTGLDPMVLLDLQEQLGALARAGRVVVLASHDLSTVERLATRVLVLWEGRLIADVHTATLLGQRVAELTLTGGALAHTAPLLERFRGAVRTGGGVAVPLLGGLTMEAMLADCRRLRIAVAASRVRYRALEDLFLAAARHAAEGPLPPAA